MFNGNLVDRLRKEQRRSVRSLVEFVFGETTKITMTYFRDRVHIDSRHIEKLSEFFQVPIQDFFLTEEEFERADINEDGKVNGKDWNRLYEHINETNPLW